MAGPSNTLLPKVYKGVTFFTDFATDQDILASGGDIGATNYGMVSGSQRLRGTFNLATVGGRSCANFHCIRTADPALWPWVAVTANVANSYYQIWDVTTPQDEYYGMGLWVPPGGFNIPQYASPKTGSKLLEIRFQNVEPPIALRLFDDNVHCDVVGGAWNGSQFAYGQGRGNVSTNIWAIPPGKFKLGAWNWMSMHVHWAADNTGAAEFYYKAENESAWNLGGSYSGIPTAVWNSGGPDEPPLPNGAPGGHYMYNIANYLNAVTADFDVYLTNFVVADTMAAVRARLP